MLLLVLLCLSILVGLLLYYINDRYSKLFTWTDITVKKNGYDYIIEYTDGYYDRHSYRGSCTVWYNSNTGKSIGGQYTKIRALQAIYNKEEWKKNSESN